jgi:hypothetical protein
MMKLGKISLFAGLFAIALSACGSARVVQRTQTGGTVALQGDRNKAMEDARQQMDGHCGPNNYQILSEGEVPIGTDTGQRNDTVANNDGSVTQTGGTSTRTATEWRVSYQCGGAAPGPVAPAPMGPPPAQPAPGY